MKGNNHPSFLPPQEFGKVLVKRVGDYFEKNKIPPKGHWLLDAKAIILFSALVVLLWFTFFREGAWWTKIILGSLLGIVVASIGFNISHDAVHGTFSKWKWKNTLLGYSFNVLGVSWYLWSIKHNRIHHHLTNVPDHDDDIAMEPFMRFNDESVWYRIHRYQHLYAPIAYGVFYFLWIFVIDFKRMFSGKILTYRIPRRTRGRWMEFALTKLAYVLVWGVLPISTIGVSSWFAGFVPMIIVCGSYLAPIFQMAHVVQEVKQPHATVVVSENDFYKHQIETTANFATDSTAAFLLLGGLNFQIEHHFFFAKYSHAHYPTISRIVRAVCEEYGYRYHAPSFFEGLRSHYRRLKQLGERPKAAI